MKKFYFLIALAVAALSSQGAQFTQKDATHKVHSVSSPVKAAHSNAVKRNHVTNHSTTVFWSDDFSNPANWVTTAVLGTDNWVIGTAGPAGTYAISPIASSTAANGFALFDSDLLCSFNQTANLTMAGTADLSSATSARVVFSQYYRHFYDSTYMFVSNNGGATWTQFNVNPNTANNNFNSNNAAAGSETNPDIVSIDISSVAAGSANVKIRFQFYSPSTLGTAAGCGYSWMIDDVSIEDVPANDIGIAQVTEGEYSCTPLLQIQPVNISARVKNYGAQVANNVQVEFNIFDGTPALVYSSQSAALSTLNSGDTSAYQYPATSFTPNDTGVYYIQYICSMTAADGNTSNDTTYGLFYVDTATYARDYTYLNSSSYLGSFGFNGNTGYLGQSFQVLQSSQFTSAQMYLGNATFGDHIAVDVFDVVGGAPNAVVGTTGSYTIGATDTGGAFITLPFLSPINVTPGNYFVALNQIDTNNVSLGAASKNVTPGTGFYQVNGGSWTDVGTVAPLCFILRVNNPFSTATGISNVQDNSRISVYPNPSTGPVFVSGLSGKTTVTVTNINGQVVFSNTYTNSSNVKFDLSNQANGIYSVRIENAAGVITRSVLISNK